MKRYVVIVAHDIVHTTVYVWAASRNSALVSIEQYLQTCIEENEDFHIAVREV